MYFHSRKSDHWIHYAQSQEETANLKKQQEDLPVMLRLQIQDNLPDNEKEKQKHQIALETRDMTNIYCVHRNTLFIDFMVSISYFERLRDGPHKVRLHSNGIILNASSKSLTPFWGDKLPR